MTIDQLIDNLQELRTNHSGETEVTVWQYGGGCDDLCNVVPMFDENIGVVVLDTICHESGIRR